MSWKFWKKEPGSAGPSEAKQEKLPPPRDIPEDVARHLVVKLNKNPDWVWRLKAVVRQRPEGKGSYDVRVFERADVAVNNYASLDEHPELILYEGWFDKDSHRVFIEEKDKPHPAPGRA